MEPYIKETINIKEEMIDMRTEMKEKKTRNLNNIVEGIKLGNRELFRDLSKSALVDTTLKKSSRNDN